MAYRNKQTGEIISDQEAQQKGIIQNVQPSEKIAPISQEKPKINFLERLKLGFGGSEAKAKQQQLEAESGLKGKFDVGDIADVAGSALPIIGGVIGGAIGTPIFGGATGAAIGKEAQIGIGQLLGVRGDQSMLSEITAPATEFATTYLGGKAISKIVSPLAKSGWSIITGQSPKISSSVFANPEIADKTLKMGTDKALMNAVEVGAQKSTEIKNNFINKFSTELEKILGNKGKIIAIPKDFIDGLDSLLPKGTRMTKEGFDFSTTKLIANPGEISNINKVYTAINNWEDFSAKGIVELKQLVGKLAKFPVEGGGSSKSPTLGKFYKYIDDLIKARLPEQKKLAYEKLNKTFSEQIDFYSEIEDAFNSGNPFSKIANLFSKNNAPLRDLVSFYEKKTGQKITPIVATRELSNEAPKSWLNIRSFVDSFLTPKVQTKLTIGAGKASKSFPVLGKSLLSQSAIRTTTKPALEITGGAIKNVFTKNPYEE